jgi:Cu+-exporting ATPase
MKARSEHAEIPIAGMTCSHCAERIGQALKAIEGVQKAHVNHKRGVAAVDYDPARVKVQQLLAAIERSGYTPGAAKLRLAIKGMRCASCVSAIEQGLKRTPGVISADVNLGTESAEVTYQPGRWIEGMRRAVHDSGYEAAPPEDQTQEGIDHQELNAERIPHSGAQVLVRRRHLRAGGVLSYRICSASGGLPSGSTARR